MKFSIALLFFSSFITNAFAEDAFEAIKQKMESDPDQAFHDGKEFAKIARDTDGKPAISVEKKGVMVMSSIAYGVFNLNPGFWFGKDANKGHPVTFNFTHQNGQKDSFACYLIDYHNCGKHILDNCGKSKLGFTIPKSYVDHVYDSSLYEGCSEKNSDISQTSKIKEKETASPSRKSNKSSGTRQ